VQFDQQHRFYTLSGNVSIRSRGGTLPGPTEQAGGIARSTGGVFKKNNKSAVLSTMKAFVLRTSCTPRSSAAALGQRTTEFFTSIVQLYPPSVPIPAAFVTDVEFLSSTRHTLCIETQVVGSWNCSDVSKRVGTHIMGTLDEERAK
jgi:hypothetical protein